jgi:hypothetical protein
MEPKYAYGMKVYIKKGFYRGYKANIKSYVEVKVKNQKTEEEETIITYTVMIENTPIKAYEVIEEWIIPYKKWVIF